MPGKKSSTQSDCNNRSVTTPTKQTKRRKVKVKAISNVKTNDDYFDESIMDMINIKLARMTMLTGLDVSGNGVVFNSKVIGRFRPDKDGPVKLLIHWEPEGLIPDEWIFEKDLDEMSSRCLALNSLPISSFKEMFDNA
ncbi:zinc finger protein AEBP2-like [Tetranychus urticae]|uniref:AEBP2-like C-terminal SH3 domain-containing protein n=1 Tax=Tetranychus urticae TaxID=32264 RepID=T1JSZ0_TETUR|nr:zinc finger protein AEBP2-like [Tetranychus urticae]